MTEEDAYELLGLKSGASSDDVKEAYRRMSLKVHPDQGGSAFLFRQVQEGYELLTKHRARAENDMTEAAEDQKAAAEKQRKQYEENERRQREENARRKEAERQQREENERRKRAESNGPAADVDMVELMSIEVEEMLDAYAGAKRGTAVEWKLSPDQAQHLIIQLEPLDLMLKSVLAGKRAMSEAERERIDAEIQVLKKPYDERYATLRPRWEEMSAKPTPKPKKKKFGFF